MREQLETRFNNLYKGCTLYCIQLNGFSHTVFYKDENNNRKIEGYSAYAPEQYDDFDDGIHGFNRDQCKALFVGIGHYRFQGNPEEIMYKDVSKW